MPLPEPKRGDVADLATLLDLEALDRDLFRGRNGDRGRSALRSTAGRSRRRRCGPRAYRARRPASRTRCTATSSGPGLPDRPVILHVDRDRDGGSFSARHVRAVQDGEVIFSMVASFHCDEPGETFGDDPPDDVVSPTTWPTRPWPRSSRCARSRRVISKATHAFSDRMWVRSASPFPDDPLVHACGSPTSPISARASGRSSGRTSRLGGPSIDHSVWFHRPVRVDDWILVDLTPERVVRCRGTRLGTLRSRDGTLAAVEECLLRWPKGAQPYRLGAGAPDGQTSKGSCTGVGFPRPAASISSARAVGIPSAMSQGSSTRSGSVVRPKSRRSM